MGSGKGFSQRRPHAGMGVVCGMGLLGIGLLFWGSPVRAGGGAPDWVNGASVKYPGEAYLVGVGSGDTRTAAEDRAYAAISRIFSAEIDSRTEEWEKYLQTDGPGVKDDRRQIGIEQATRISSQRVLENVLIAERWMDEEKAIYYALAVMDRRHASASLRDRLTSIDLSVEERLKQARTSGDKLIKVRALHAALQNLILREVYNAQLRVVNPAGRGMDEGAGLARVNRELREFLAGHFKISVDVTGSHPERFRSAIQEGLNREGFSVADPASGGGEPAPDLTVKGRVTLEAVELRSGRPPKTYFVRWSAAFELNNPASGQSIGSVRRQGREGHLTPEEAESRALRSAEREVSEGVGSQLTEYIFGSQDESREISPAP